MSFSYEIMPLYDILLASFPLSISNLYIFALSPLFCKEMSWHL